MRLIYLIIFFILIFTGCVSVDNSAKEDTTQKDTVLTENNEKGIYGLTKMNEYLENGIDKINYGSISEGIKQLILVLAEYEAMNDPQDEAIELAKEAEIQLKKLEVAMSFEVEPEWTDKNMNQISGSSIDINPQPSIILTIDTGLGRSLVANVPILFKFTKGSGILSASIENTNDFGQANVIITRFKNPNEENIIEASILYREKSFTYMFENLKRTFIYVPPKRKATIFVMEQSELGISEDPKIFDVIYNKLKDVAFDFSLYNASLNPDIFRNVYNGDKNAIAQLGLNEDVSYVVAVLNDCFNINQMVIGGKKYNMYTSQARATIRIIRIADGKTLYNKTISRLKADGKHGQGNSKEKSSETVLNKITKDMEMVLEEDINAINKALTGQEQL